MNTDSATRRTAIDPQQSFIVQAPAGSGKTELLIQRYLSLLMTVSSPEEILAITFTNKAAYEMRERINQALLLAAQPEPETEYKRLTWYLAQQALKRSQQFDWGLLTNPQRLRIQTIDSLCLYLVRHMPFLSGLGMGVNIGNEQVGNSFYEAAAENLLLKPIDELTAQLLQDLLLHLDNNLLQVRDLLVHMLRKRDQWLNLLKRIKSKANLRHYLQHNLQSLVQNNLQQAENYFPSVLLKEADELLTYVSSQQEKIPASQHKALKYWQSIATLLLTQDNQWRRQLTKNDGFPPKSAGRDETEKNYFEAQKKRAFALLACVAPLEDLRDALVSVRLSPPPYYTEQQWKIITALLHLLPIAAAELKVLFQQHNKVDFIEMALAASQALGDADSPSDLALRLDYQLKHILVDEFQDTAASQFALLELLTAGWQQNDGRTLFLVGDPMQSIYRFRAAEVGLFLRAQQHGIGNIPLVPLILHVNFRSQANIINWINRVFSKAFPQHEDIASNKVKFTPSLPANSPLAAQVELYYQTENQSAATQKIVTLIQQAGIDDPHGSIAVLVRSRSHLSAIIPALQKNNIAYQAIDIEHLAENITIQDLISLSCALLHPGDRLAWLSLLRSPCCGLTLVDLHVIAQNGQAQTISERLADQDALKKLSIDGQQRIQYLRPLLHAALSGRQRLNLRDWIEQTWLALRGPATVNATHDLVNANTFFELLSKLETNEILINRFVLTEQLNTLYAAPTALKSGTVQLMTVHKAKGLEFDTVIIPAIEKLTQHDPQQLLLWLEQPREDRGSDLFIAPIKARYDDEDPIYSYLKNQQNRIADYETIRLLYVAATRAKKRLYFFAQLESDKDSKLKKPAERTWLAKLWPSCKAEFTLLAASAETETKSITVAKCYLRRLSSTYFV